MEEKNKSGMHIASLVLGIISIITAAFWYMAWPTSILAMVFGVKSIRRTGSKIAKAGLITGIVGISLSVFIYVSLVLVMIFSYM